MRSAQLVVRSASSIDALAPAVRAVVTGLDPEVPVYSVRTLQETRESTRAVTMRRVILYPLLIFALLAAVIAAVGVYALLGYVVADRTREIGVRLALGAAPGQVWRLLVRQGLTPIVTGTPPNWFFPSEPYVGPIRSGRLTYNQIGGTFPNSCLVYASAAWDIGEMLDACKIVYGVDPTTPNSALLTVTDLRELAEQSLNPRQPVNYSGNVFSAEAPPGGQPANAIQVFYHSFTQSAWRYDPISQTYLRWTDLADGTGSLIPATDRLTERQMAFENVIAVFAEHHRFRHNQLEIDFSLGQKHPAYLFRDGQAFKIFWSTENRDWEQETGLVRPLHLVDGQNEPVALRPGRTWIHIITPFSSVTDEGNGEWLVQFVQPYDPTDTPIPSDTPAPTPGIEATP